METRSDAGNRIARWGLFAGMMAAVYAANWAIEQWGVVGLPLTGLEAPAGVYFAGLTFGLRDALHEVGGARWVVGAIVDSALFLWLAFGGLDFLAGQVVGKVAMIVPALPIVWLARRRYSDGI